MQARHYCKYYSLAVGLSQPNEKYQRTCNIVIHTHSPPANRSFRAHKDALVFRIALVHHGISRVADCLRRTPPSLSRFGIQCSVTCGLGPARGVPCVTLFVPDEAMTQITAYGKILRAKSDESSFSAHHVTISPPKKHLVSSRLQNTLFAFPISRKWTSTGNFPSQ